jgi:hypothetical protein
MLGALSGTFFGGEEDAYTALFGEILVTKYHALCNLEKRHGLEEFVRNSAKIWYFLNRFKELLLRIRKRIEAITGDFRLRFSASTNA